MQSLRLPLAALLAALTPFAHAADAPLGTAITYQGHLVDNGAPAENLYDMRFKLFDAAQGGIELGNVFVESVPVEDGHFTVNLDFGNTAFNGSARFLEIYVGPENAAQLTMLKDRQGLKASPEALHSRSANTVNWSGVTNAPQDFSDNVDNVGLTNIGIGAGLAPAGQLSTSGQTISIAANGVQSSMIAAGAVGAAQVDKEAVQLRVNGSCQPGSFVTAVTEAGGLACAVAPVAEVSGHVVKVLDDGANSLSIGLEPRMVIGSDGMPVIATTLITADGFFPALVRCADSRCTQPPARHLLRAMPSSSLVFTDAMIGTDGLPVVVEWDNTATKIIAHFCNEMTCASNTSVTLATLGTNAVTALSVGKTGAGNPLIAFHDAANADLVLISCLDSACANRQLNAVNLAASYVPAGRPQLAVGADNLPVISTIDGEMNTNAVMLIKCNDGACTGDNEGVSSIDVAGLSEVVSPAGHALSIDPATGFPSIAAFLKNNTGIVFGTCSDASCASSLNGGLVAGAGFLPTGGIGLAYTSDGLPKLAFTDGASLTLRFASCADHFCSTSSVTTVAGRTAAGFTPVGLSTVISVSGEPMIAFADFADNPGVLRFVKCANRSCQ